MLFNKSLFSSLALAAAVAASSHDAPRRRHAGLSTLEHEPAHNGTLLRRGQSFQNTRFSMYYPETGNQVACGGYYHDGDWIVALNIEQFESISGHMCGQTITMSLNGKSHDVTIVDACPGCPWGGLDCTPAVANYFGFFNDLAWGSWTVGGGSDPAPPPSSSAPPPPPSSTTKPHSSSTPPPPPPSSTSHSHSSTHSSSSSTWSSSSSSSWSASSSSATSSSAASSTSSTASSTSASSTSSTAAATPTSNLNALSANLVNMALLALAGENSAAN